MDKSHVTEAVIKEKKLINNVNGVKIYAVWYEKQYEVYNNIRF